MTAYAIVGAITASTTVAATMHKQRRYAKVGAIPLTTTVAATMHKRLPRSIVGSVPLATTVAATMLKRHKAIVGAVPATITPASTLYQYLHKIVGTTTISTAVASTMLYHSTMQGALGFPSLSLSAASHAVAPITGALDFPTFAASGLAGATCALTFPALSLSATATVDEKMNANVPFAVLSVSASMTVDAKITAAAGFVSFTVTGRGGAAAALGFPALSLSATSTAETKWPGASLAFPVLSLSATATQDNQFAGSLDFPIFTMPHVDGALGFVTFTVAGSTASALSNAVAYVMNIHTTESTTYTNYPFTYLMHVGDLLVGVGADGLYTFDATTDSGTEIAASITTKETDFGLFHSKRVSQVYLNSDTATTVRPKVDGVWAPRVYPSSFGGRKAEIARGLEGRYWAFQINNIQQLEGLEVSPETRQRRVK